MAESITDVRNDGYNNYGDSIITPEAFPTGTRPPNPIGLDEDESAIKAFAYAEIAEGNNTAENKRRVRENVRQSLLSLGSATEVDELEETLTQTRQRRSTDMDIQNVIDARFGPEEVATRASDSVAAGTVQIEDELLIRLSETSDMEAGLQDTEQNHVTRFSYSDWVNRTNEEKFAVDAAISDIVAGMDPSYISLLGDLTAEIAPFALGIFSAKLAADMEVAQGGSTLDVWVARMKGFLAPGEIRNDIRKVVMSVDPADRPDMARQLAISVRDNSGIIFDNDTETIDWIEHVISSADERAYDDSFDWDRTLYNMITFLDAIPLLSRGIKGSVGGIRSWMSEAGRLNRKRARDFLKENANDPEALKGLAVSADEMVGSQVPKTALEAVDSSPQIVSEQLELVLDGAENAVRLADNTAINYTAGEVNQFVDKLASAYQSLKGGVLNINKFVVDVSQGDRVLTDAFYSRTKNEGGWLSPKSALNAAVKLTDNDLTKVTLLVRESDGSFSRMLTGPEIRDTFGAHKASAHDGNEYFLQVKDTHYMSEIDKMAFGGEPVYFTGPFGSGRYLGDATAQFSDDVWRPSYVAMGTEAQFEKSVIELANQFWSLPRSGRNRVTRLLEQGAKDKRTYTPQELVVVSDTIEGGASALTVGDIKGYYAMRAANDAVWATANQQVFRELNKKGFRSFFLSDNTQAWVTRPHNSSDPTVTRALDPHKMEIVDITPEMIKAWEKKGGGIEVFHSNAPWVQHGIGEDTMFVIRNGGTKSMLGRLPTNPLKYEGGYISRIYDDQYFVNRVENVLRNGQKVEGTSAVNTARTLAEAEEQAAILTADTGVLHKANTTVSGGSRLIDDTMLIEQDRLVFGHRLDNPLTRAGTDQAMLADPIESLHRAVSATGRQIGIENYVRNQEVSFYKTYSDMIDAKVWKEYQNARFGADKVALDLRHTANTSVGAQSERALEALQLWNYYRMLRGVAEPLAMRGWRAGFRNMADKMERQLGLNPSVSRAIADVGKIDPFSIVKGLAFTTLIVGNPIRQYALQSAQFIYIAGANPRIAAAAAGHAPVMRIGLANIDTPAWPAWRDSIAKVLRITPDETELMIRNFKNSGLVAEIDSYGYMGATLTDPNITYRPSAFGGAAQTTANAIKWPFQKAKKHGFNHGEVNNLSMTYTFAMKEFLAKSGKRIAELQPREWQEIASQASGYALGMHKAGSLGYQQGALSVLTQFWSIGHKAFAGMLPGTYGSKVFTNKQKATIAATQFGIYGAAGFGIHDMVQNMMGASGVMDSVPQDKAELITRVVATGMGEMFLNHALSEQFDEPVDLAFSTSFAPSSGAVNTVWDFIDAAFTLDVSQVLGRGTAAGSTLGRYTDMFSYLNYTLNMSQVLPDTPSKLERIMRVSPTVFSGYTNAMKAFYAMRTGQLVSAFGDHRSNASYTEAVLKGLLGVQTHAEADVMRIYGLDGKAFAFDANVAEDIAAHIYRAMNKNLVAFEGLDQYNFTRAAAAIEGERLILELLEPHEQEQVRAAFFDLANKKRGDPDDVLQTAIRFAREGAVSPERIYSEVRTILADPALNQERDATLKLLQDMIEGRNDRMEWYREQNHKFNDENQFLLEEN